MPEERRPAVSLPELYPDFDPAQLQNAQMNFERYLSVVLRVHKRILREQGIRLATSPFDDLEALP